jgi:signal recognition particle subunit SRP54
MLEIVSKGFKSAKAALTGKTVLTEANIDEAVREIRVSLLEADVELGVVRAFLDRVKQRALGEVVTTELEQDGKKLRKSPEDHFVLICHHELEKLMGPVEEVPIVYRRPYTVIMMVGLQGTGKTTTCGKLASYLVAQGRRPLLVAADVYRPAAIDQLKVLGSQVGVPVFAQPDLKPPQLCQDALREAKKKKRDVVIFDTAGRLAIDDALMIELEEIKRISKPDNVFLVVDAMSGQDAVRTASEFNRRVDITGFVMTKLDGDARGGAALSIKEITGKPIKFLGVGEGMAALEPFRPEGLASRILGMGDIVGLMKDFEAVVDEKQAERDTKKLLRGQFTLDDFMAQLGMLKKVGSVKDIYEKFPIFGDTPPEGATIDDDTFTVMESMIQSMTRAERQTPSIIDDKRTIRIAKGSGRKPEQVKDLLGRFGMMHQMMQSLVAQPGLLGMLPGFKQLSQLRQFKGMGNLNDLMGDPAKLQRMARGGGMPMSMPGGGMPGLPAGMGMPGLPGLPGGGGGLPGLPGGAPGMGMPPGMSPEQMQQMAAMMGRNRPAGAPKPLNSKDRDRLKQKRRAEKAARKKSRRR